MALYRRKDSDVFWYDFSVGGRRFRGSTQEGVLARARQVESILINEAKRRGRLVAQTKIPLLREYAARFLDYIEQTPLDPDTKRYYRTGWRLLSNTKLADMRLDHITTADAEIAKFPGAAATANCAFRTLRRILSQAKACDLIQATPKIKTLLEYGRSTLIEPEIEQRLLSVAKQPLYDVLLIIQDAGMRPEEVFRMRWENILWNRNVIFIPFGKSRIGSRRFVPLSSRVRERLERRRSAGNRDWVFPSPRSRSGHIVSVAKQFEQARRDADLPVTLVLYCARHTFATDLLAQTGNLALVRDVLGHRDIKTTEKYLHPASTQLAEIIDLRNAKNG